MKHPRDRVIVTLDSGHRKPHVLAEQRIYNKQVTSGNYRIVGGADINAIP